jgi:cobalamin biosynthetic protein CobC
LLEHGGALRTACVRYGIAFDDWLDLSTGINPLGYPAPSVPETVWRRLPEINDGLEQAAAAYYGSDQLLAVAGSQAVIQALPVLRQLSRIGILSPSYAEHAHAWQCHGHQVELLSAQALTTAVDAFDVVVVINPNNPTGERFASTTLLEWRARLAVRGGWLVIDEAFMDATPGKSIASYAGLPGLIVLRSLGKFFGLAGARVGFVLAEAGLREKLEEQLGPWAVNGPGRWVATRALTDRAWQQQTRQALARASARLVDLLNCHGLAVAGGTALFQWVIAPKASYLQDALARRGLWVRRFDDPLSLRIGLPGSEAAWQRLASALAAVTTE